MKKTLKEWLKDFLRQEDVRDGTLPKDVEDTTVEKLINRAGRVPSESGAIQEGLAEDIGKDSDKKPDEITDCPPKESCPYAMKRNIVVSLNEIRQFAEENKLASAMVRALLTTLAELVLNALKGKVSGAMLALVLNALNFDKARNEAYKEGEIAGRNQKITEEYFPKNDDGLPHIQDKGMPIDTRSDIFTFARKAR